MFTKSQFEKVADVLVKSAPRAYGPESQQHWETVKAFIEEFTDNNPKFDQGKFLTYLLSKMDEQQMLAFQAAVDGKPIPAPTESEDDDPTVVMKFLRELKKIEEDMKLGKRKSVLMPLRTLDPESVVIPYNSDDFKFGDDIGGVSVKY